MDNTSIVKRADIAQDYDSFPKTNRAQKSWKKFTNLMQKASNELQSLFRKQSESEKIFSSKINIIGAVGIADRTWKGEEGKELWQSRYKYERIAIWERDKAGNPIRELHIYANSLESLYKEWEAKIENGEIPETIRVSNIIEIPNKSLRFDGYVEHKMEIDEEFKKKLIALNVRYLNDEELDSVKAVFDDKDILQIGLDSTSPEPKNLPQGDYAFVMGQARKDDKEMQALYLAKKKGTDKGLIQHSSFLRSGKVASAGIIEINDQGKIQTVIQYSGHYLPSHAEVATTLKFLREYVNEEDFKNINVSVNKYTGLMLKITMAINTVAKKQGYKLDLGMVEFNAKEWLDKLENPPSNKPVAALQANRISYL